MGNGDGCKLRADATMLLCCFVLQSAWLVPLETPAPLPLDESSDRPAKTGRRTPCHSLCVISLNDFVGHFINQNDGYSPLRIRGKFERIFPIVSVVFHDSFQGKIIQPVRAMFPNISLTGLFDFRFDIDVLPSRGGRLLVS